MTDLGRIIAEMRDYSAGPDCDSRIIDGWADRLAALAGAAPDDPWQPSGNDDYDRSIHCNPNAHAWADFFVATFPGQAAQHHLMLGWFANAMMAMHDHLKAATHAPAKAREDVAKLVNAARGVVEMEHEPRFLYGEIANLRAALATFAEGAE